MTLQPDMLVQLASLVVYLATFIWGGLAYFDIRAARFSRPVKYIAAALVTLSLLTVTLFVSAQLPWIMNGQWREMPLVELLTWLMYDWVNGLAHLATVLAVRTLMRWEQPTPCQANGVCPSARLARRSHEQDRELSNVANEIDALQTRIDQLNARYFEDSPHD